MVKKIDQKSLPPLLFAAQTKGEEARLAALKKAHRVRRIGPRLYTSLPKSEVAKYVRSQWAQIVSKLFPGALLSHRSAIEYSPDTNGRIFLTSTTNREVKYPGLTLEFVRGPGLRPDDLPFLDFHASSLPRALLETLSVTKRTAHRGLSQDKIEKRLLEILRSKGEDELNKVRDRALKISNDLGFKRELAKLTAIVSAILGTNSNFELRTDNARARAKGRPFDVNRIARFDLLMNALRATPLKEFGESLTHSEHLRNKAFFEAYFSNYIEGTQFEIEEAEEIIFDKKIPENRPKDAHDILGTFSIVSDSGEMTKTPESFGQLMDLIVHRHETLMQNRPEAKPGEFKDKPNRAGDSHFVRPDEVEGTIEQGFSRYEQVPKGLARAIFIMFLVTEVHPFWDGNGRIARVMMNAELHASGLTTIIIPNVYREDYLSGLRALTRRDRPDPLIKMLARAHQFSNLDFRAYRTILGELERRNWFRDPSDAKII